MTLPRVVAVTGPTASGKGALGLELAERLDAPILVCDSVKVYRGLDIGSAKPSLEARSRTAHHLIDLVDPDEAFSAGDYARHAWAAFHDHGGVFVGGTGFYLRATAWTLTGGDVDRISASHSDGARAEFEAAWRTRETADTGAAHRALAALDPETADEIHPHNLARTLRALWLCRVHGGPVSRARREDPPQPRMELLAVVLDPGVEAVDQRIEARVDAMLRAGWLGEVEKLLKAGYDETSTAMRSLGYRQLLDVALGRTELRAARDSIVVATRQYARRQRTYVRTQIPAAQTILVQNPAACPHRRIEAFLEGR